jgi:hypothetical protein
MLAVYGIGLIIALILMIILIWKIGAVGFVFLILGGLYILTSPKK